MKCPECGLALYPVKYPSGSPLNRDQWESTRAGDFYCTSCTSDVSKSGFRYFWEHELKKWTDTHSDQGPPPLSEDPDYEKYREYHRKRDILLGGHVQEFWQAKCRELSKPNPENTNELEDAARHWLAEELRKLADHIDKGKWPFIFGCFIPKDGVDFKEIMAEWRVVLSHPWGG